MMKKISAIRYVEGDGKTTLASLADVLVSYFSDWITADWIKVGKSKPISKQTLQSPGFSNCGD